MNHVEVGRPFGKISRRKLCIGGIWVSLAILLAACGGGDSDSSESDDAGPTLGISNDSDRSDGSASSAAVTIGTKVYEFTIDLPNQCNDTGTLLFGTFAQDAEGNALEGGDGNRSVALIFGIPVTDWKSQDLQPPQIAVDDALTGERWQAGGVTDASGVDPSESEVLEWTKDGGSASGTATFIDLNAHFAGQETEPVEGTFDIVCAS